MGVVNAIHLHEVFLELRKGISLWYYDNSSSCSYFLQGDFEWGHMFVQNSYCCHDNRVLTFRFEFLVRSGHLVGVPVMLLLSLKPPLWPGTEMASQSIHTQI